VGQSRCYPTKGVIPEHARVIGAVGPPAFASFTEGAPSQEVQRQRGSADIGDGKDQRHRLAGTDASRCLKG
jgi:hypothetical protein